MNLPLWIQKKKLILSEKLENKYISKISIFKEKNKKENNDLNKSINIVNEKEKEKRINKANNSEKESDIDEKKINKEDLDNDEKWKIKIKKHKFIVVLKFRKFI